MGTLTPGATYIYERVGKNIYARESGKLERKLIGYDYDESGENIVLGLEKLADDVLWQDIKKLSETNQALKNAIEQVILIYNTAKKYEE